MSSKGLTRRAQAPQGSPGYLQWMLVFFFLISTPRLALPLEVESLSRPPRPDAASQPNEMPEGRERRWRMVVLGAGAIAVVAISCVTTKKRHRLQAQLEERERSEKILAMEHELRLQAERAVRESSQRLLHAHEVERSRVARELHDDVTQRLARLAIDAAQAELAAPPGSTNGILHSIREELGRLSEDVHSLAYRLHPSVLDELGLVEALRTECDRFGRCESIPTTLKADIVREIPRELGLCLMRIAQESLRNVARHADAHTVEVSLRETDGGIQLAICDDGTGFDPKQHRARPSLGHASMRERISLVGGELDIDTAVGHGTTVVAWAPLNLCSRL